MSEIKNQNNPDNEAMDQCNTIVEENDLNDTPKSNNEIKEEVNKSIEESELNEIHNDFKEELIETNINEAETIDNTEIIVVEPSIKHKHKAKLSKKLILIVLLIILAIIGTTMFFILKPVSVKTIKISKRDINIAPGEKYKITYLIGPEDASDKTVTWTCSDNTVVKLTEGTIEGLKEGSCEVRAITSNENIYDYCIVTVEEPVPDFKAIFDKCCSGESLVATLGSDYSYIEIDSNPFDIDDFSLPTSSVIQSINNELGIPSSVYNKMLNTNAMQGRQTMEYSKFTVSWTYHPDNGLEVIYELKAE